MKPIVLILSLFVLALTGFPCCAQAGERADSCTKERADSCTEEQADAPLKKNDCSKDCCPFYVCGGCTGFVLSSPSLFVSILPSGSSAWYSSYLPFKIRQVAISVWQPPQLS